MVIPCLHYFFGPTEKQDVRDLPGLSRTRDPGEGELEACVQGWRAVGWDQEGDERVRIYVCGGG